MIYYFLDTSAFVKIYAYEPGERQVRALLSAAVAPTPAARIVVCDLVIPEAMSALQQRFTHKQLTRRAFDDAVNAIIPDLLGPRSPYVVVEASGVMSHSGELARLYRLRGGDAIHLAAALATRASTPPGYGFRFVTTDHDQADAARAEGFPLYDPVTDTLA